MDKTKTMWSTDDVVGVLLLSMASAEVLLKTNGERPMADIFGDDSTFEDLSDTMVSRFEEVSKYISPNALKLFMEVQQDERLEKFSKAAIYNG